MEGLPSTARCFGKIIEIVFGDGKMPSLFAGSRFDRAYSLCVPPYDYDVVSVFRSSNLPVTLRQIQASPVRRTNISRVGRREIFVSLNMLGRTHDPCTFFY